MKQPTLKKMIETRLKTSIEGAAKKNYRRTVKRCHKFFEGIGTKPEITVENNECFESTKFKYRGALAINMEVFYSGAEGLLDWDIDHRDYKKSQPDDVVKPSIENGNFPFSGKPTYGDAALGYNNETKLDPVKEGWQDFLAAVKKHLLKTSYLKS